jgi:hypothetical protein
VQFLLKLQTVSVENLIVSGTFKTQKVVRIMVSGPSPDAKESCIKTNKNSRGLLSKSKVVIPFQQSLTFELYYVCSTKMYPQHVV